MPEGRLLQVLHYVGANLHRARLAADLTQEDLAERAGIDVRFLQRVERSQTNFSVAVLVAVADALQVEPGKLLKATERLPARRGRVTRQRNGT
jgi:transcriptional regulator with XRE-family HTH domain